MQIHKSKYYEDGLLNAALVWPEKHPAIFNGLLPEHFDPGLNRKVFAVLARTYNETKSDKLSKTALVTEICTVLAQENRNWQFWAQHFTVQSAFATDIDFYIKRIKQNYNRRRLIEISNDAQKKIELDDNAENIAENMKVQLTNLEPDYDNAGPVSLHDVAGDTIEILADGGQEVTGIQTGYRSLDNYIIGLRPGDLLVVAGRPSQGKTTLAMNIAANIAKRNYVGLVFSLEMSQYRLGLRILASESRVNLNMLSKGNLNFESFRKVNDSMVRSLGNLYIDFSKGLTSTEIERRIRRFSDTSRLDFVVVDYLQKFRYPGHVRHDLEVGQATGMLKNISGELGLATLLVSQLNRANEKDGKVRMPRLSDLRDSGAIEQDADIAMFIHRPEIYEKNESLKSKLKGQASIDIAKNRDGETGIVMMSFIGHLNRFEDFVSNEEGVKNGY